MEYNNKGRSWLMPDALTMIQSVNELVLAVNSEEKSITNLLNTYKDPAPGEVCMFTREAAIHTLRYLKFWFDLPGTVFFVAVNFLDRFLTRMKVKEKYLACVSISCLYISATIQGVSVDPQKLVTMSQTKCSIRDLQRMCDIIKLKLNIEANGKPITVLDYLGYFLRVFETAVAEMDVQPLYYNVLTGEHLVKRLEIVMTNSVCASHRPTVVALCLMQADIELFYNKKNSSTASFEKMHLLSILFHLQRICSVSSVEFMTCYKKTLLVVDEYDDSRRINHNQKLLWRFSSCTVDASKPSENFTSSLSTLFEYSV